MFIPHEVVASGHILAKAAPSGGQLMTGLVAVGLVAGAIYAKKHKGWDVPQMAFGFILCVAVSATPWGGAIVSACSQALSGGAGAISAFLG